ncbi:hypothetical protein [Pseudomonas solani]|uniref:hypothetical protein n=1 Tax=Pseudomonas solani TaxID=2731552 RepID=UPI0022368C58|nr:hypothetical protein [Pseudomonas solani]
MVQTLLAVLTQHRVGMLRYQLQRHFCLGRANACQRISALALKGVEIVPVDEVLKPHLRSSGDGCRGAGLADQPQFENDVFMCLMPVLQQQLCKQWGGGLIVEVGECLQGGVDFARVEGGVEEVE